MNKARRVHTHNGAKRTFISMPRCASLQKTTKLGSHSPLCTFRLALGMKIEPSISTESWWIVFWDRPPTSHTVQYIFFFSYQTLSRLLFLLKSVHRNHIQHDSCSNSEVFTVIVRYHISMLTGPGWQWIHFSRKRLVTFQTVQPQRHFSFLT